MRNPEEQRRHKRLKVAEDVFLTFRPRFAIMSKLKDISKGGVAFEYFMYEDSKILEMVEIDIFSKDKDLHIFPIPCSVVYDIPVPGIGSSLGIQTRRCGLQFTQLKEQSKLIDSMLGSNTRI